jgi:hypothetical protein
MDDFESKHMAELELLGVRTWFRYVDDTFVLLEKGSKVEEVVEVLNSKHANIKFTFEEEKKKKIPFLDVSVTRSGDSFHTTVYHKPTFTGVYLNWFSLTAKEYKIGLIRCLVDRAWRICSSYVAFHQELTNIKTVLRKNDYPEFVIDETIKKYLDRKYRKEDDKNGKGQTSKSVVQEAKRNLYLVLPYMNNKMEEFSHRIRNIVGKFYPEVQLRVMFTCPKKLSSFFPFKSTTPQHLRYNVVYKIKCSTCDSFYVGKTVRCLERRIKEHANGTGTEENKSALYRHTQDKPGHVIDYNNVEICDTASDYRKLLLKEMLIINELRPDLNKQKNSALFSLIIGRKQKKS